MAEVKETKSIGDNLQGGIANAEHFLENNKKAVGIGVGVIAVIVLAAIYVFAKWLPDENLKAQKAMYMAEFAFAKDSFALALNGDAANKGFLQIADKYSMTKAGNLAHYYAGVCCLNLKKYDEAIKHLDKFSTKDPIIGALKLNGIGDAYAEQGKYDESLNYYESAANFSDNNGYTPYFLLKAGLAYERQKKYAEAKKLYEKIRDKYPTSEEGRDIEKYIARANAGS